MGRLVHAQLDFIFNKVIVWYAQKDVLFALVLTIVQHVAMDLC